MLKNNLRGALGMLCAIVETLFVKAIWKLFGTRVGKLTFLFLLFSPGMFISSTAYLPSSFSMVFVMAAYTFWLEEQIFCSLLCFCISVLLGWPFVGILAVPVGVYMLFSNRLLKVIFIAF